MPKAGIWLVPGINLIRTRGWGGIRHACPVVVLDCWITQTDRTAESHARGLRERRVGAAGETRKGSPRALQFAPLCFHGGLASGRSHFHIRFLSSLSPPLQLWVSAFFSRFFSCLSSDFFFWFFGWNFELVAEEEVVVAIGRVSKV